MAMPLPLCLKKKRFPGRQLSCHCASFAVLELTVRDTRTSPATDKILALTHTASTNAYACASAQLTERRSEMTAPAFLPKAAVMDVLAVMAVNTTSARRIYLVSRTRVTRHACDSLVSAIKEETRFVVMVEVPNTPVTWIVANVTVRPQLSLVRIILAMAAHTGARCILESLCLVTVSARDFQVTA